LKATGPVTEVPREPGHPLVSPNVHFLWDEGENGAAEDANDHDHPGWRALPVVGRLPHQDGGAAHSRAVAPCLFEAVLLPWGPRASDEAGPD
jgi:hypothetical protein